MPKIPRIKITEGVRDDRLRTPLVPSVSRDSLIPGFALIATQRAAHWCLFFQPPGRRPDGRRWGGGARVTLGDAFLMPVEKARTAALAAKLLIREGKDPLKEQQARRAAAVAQRAPLAPTLARDAFALYDKAVRARSEPKLNSRLQHLRYVAKALNHLGAHDRQLKTISTGEIRIMLETMQVSAARGERVPASRAERRHVYVALTRFLTWCRKRELILVNPCDDLDDKEKPPKGKSRGHVPSVATLRKVWAAAEGEQPHVRDLLRLLLLLPFQRTEACLLRWHEVDFEGRRIVLGAERMKNDTGFIMPLSAPALELLAARKPADARPDAFVFPTAEGKAFNGWQHALVRIRKAIGEGENDRGSRFNPHDIRRSFVSELAERKFDPDLLDLVLAHTRRGIFGIYQRSLRMEERKAAVEAWGCLITGAAIAGNVVQIHAAR
jgi:integrase